jgi:hypothetical protein
MTISSTPSVWASRVGRYLRFATARATHEPSPVSRSRPTVSVPIAEQFIMFAVAALLGFALAVQL